MQAIHDLLYYFPDVTKFDHLEFPGVVPRTFLGALVVSGIARPLKLLVHNPLRMELFVRAILAMFSSLSLRYFFRGVQKLYGYRTYSIGILITISQFHLMYYSSRFLPNTFALNLVLLAFGGMLRGKDSMAIAILGFTAAVFRFEIAVLAIFVLLSKREMLFVNIFRLVKGVAIATIFLVPIDSYFWGKLIWPELVVFYFNVVLNKSGEWGISPWHWYITSGLIGTMLLALPISVISIISNASIRKLCLPSVAFVATMSMLPHKELRFIFHTIPVFNVAAAHWLGSIRRRGFVITAIILLNIATTLIRVLASIGNYPSGVALVDAQRVITGPAYIHIDVSSAMSGISRFLEYRKDWKYFGCDTLITGL